MNFINWIVANYVELFGAILGLVAVAEVIVRLTPTQKDDGAVERIGSFIKKVADFLKIPNVKK